MVGKSPNIENLLLRFSYYNLPMNILSRMLGIIASNAYSVWGWRSRYGKTYACNPSSSSNPPAPSPKSAPDLGEGGERGSQLSLKRLIQNARHERIQLLLRLLLPQPQLRDLRLQAIQVCHQPALLFQWGKRKWDGF